MAASCSAMTGSFISLGKLASEVCERYRCPLSSLERRWHFGRVADDPHVYPAVAANIVGDGPGTPAG